MIQLTDRERGQNECLYTLCLFVHVGELGHFHLLAGSDVVDGQMAGEEKNV